MSRFSCGCFLTVLSHAIYYFTPRKGIVAASKGKKEKTRKTRCGARDFSKGARIEEDRVGGRRQGITRFVRWLGVIEGPPVVVSFLTNSCQLSGKDNAEGKEPNLLPKAPQIARCKSRVNRVSFAPLEARRRRSFKGPMPKYFTVTCTVPSTRRYKIDTARWQQKVQGEQMARCEMCAKYFDWPKKRYLPFGVFYKRKTLINAHSRRI